MTIQTAYRNSLPATAFWLAVVWTGVGPTAFPLETASAQSSVSPLTNLSPIHSPGAGATPGRSPSGSLFDPYSTGAGSNSLGAPGGASLGSPYAPAGGVGGGGGNPSYPNGSLLGGLFSGSLFGAGSGGATNYQGAGYPGTLYPPANGSASPYAAPPVYNYGTPNDPTLGPSFPASPPSGYGAPVAPFPSTTYPSGSPSTLFPGGLFGSPGGFMAPGFSPESWSMYRFLQGPRLRHTYISGGDEFDSLGMNQTDVSMGFAFNNFLYSNRPLFVVPSFSLYMFDGPVTPVGGGADLPGSAYGGFLDFGWQSDPNRMIGGELGVRVGAFTDFDTFNEDSIRVMGKGLLSFRLTPASTLKGGVYYLDRHDIALLPAGGLLWQPNPLTRFDIFFPEPKLARYWRTIGTQDVWWYFAGEFGGDSWTVTRLSGVEERVDLDQIAVTFGLEWGRSDLIRTGQRTAFMEVGYVFSRELDYEVSPDDLSLDDAFLVRAGIGY